MSKINLYVIPSSEAECNQLLSFVTSNGWQDYFKGYSPFRVGKIAWFWSDKTYTTNYIGSLVHLGTKVTPNELVRRHKG